MRSGPVVLGLIAIGVSAVSPVAGQDLPDKLSRTQAAVPVSAKAAGEEARNWTAVTVELKPGSVQSWQVPPSGEVVYVMEGVGRLEAEGQPSMALNRGTVATLDSTSNRVVRNTSRTKTLKVLVLSQAEKKSGQPLRLNRGAGPNGTAGMSLSNEEAAQQARDARHDRNDIGLIF